MEVKIVAFEEISELVKEILASKNEIGYKGMEKDLERINNQLRERLSQIGFFAFSHTPTHWDGTEWISKGKPIIYLHNVPEDRIEYTLGHETLHIALQKIGMHVLTDINGSVVRGGIDELLDFIQERINRMNFYEINGWPLLYTKTDVFIIKWLYDIQDQCDVHYIPLL